jgi:hypothetical protein
MIGRPLSARLQATTLPDEMHMLFADMEFTGIEFDPSILEAYVEALLAVAGVVFLFTRLTRDPPAYDSAPGLSHEDRKKMLSAIAASGRCERKEKAVSTAPPGRRASRHGAGAGRGAPPPSDPREQRGQVRRKGRPVKIVLANPADGQPTITCWVVDRSRGGLGLMVPQPLTPGTRYQARAVDAPEELLPVQLEVRSCRPKGTRWRVGCRFTSEVPWGVLLHFG